jgi:L-aminopeptidase/D-esterase-like protein
MHSIPRSTGLDLVAGLPPRIGIRRSGPRDAISDVACVTVGHFTLDEGEVQTGVAVVRPNGGDLFRDRVPAAAHMNEPDLIYRDLAYHEAAHQVMASALGVSVRGVEIGEGKGRAYDALRFRKYVPPVQSGIAVGMRSCLRDLLIEQCG